LTPHRRTSFALPLIAALLLAACDSPATPSPSAPTTSASPSGSAGPADTGPIAVGPAAIALSEFPSSDAGAGLIERETTERADARTRAGFATRVGPGWAALAATVDKATDAAVRAIAPDLGVDPPVALSDPRVASIAGPPIGGRARTDASAAAVALIMGALMAGKALGQGGTHQSSSSSTETSTEGDNVVTVTARATGTIVSTGSRVVADFSIDLTGGSVNSVTGVSAQMHGAATVHVEIDGCPDASGSSKGKVSLVSSEDVAGGAEGGSASWRRQLSGQFDISVDDGASISGMANSVDVSETVQNSGPSDPNVAPHDLGITARWAVSAGTGFSGIAERPGTTDANVYQERDATRAQAISLAHSAAYAVNAAAILLGQEAERFWRGGKCVELIVDPAGGDVDPDSITEVVAKVKHKFEGNELDKPVEATLAGTKSIDPVGQKQPAPATVKFTAGAREGDVGEIAFKTTSNRGIAEKSVKFTVRQAAWKVTFDGTDKEAFPPVIKNSFKAHLDGLTIKATDNALTGTGRLHLTGPVTAGLCSGNLDVTATSTVTGTLVGTGPEAKLHIIIRSKTPAAATVTMHCPGRNQVLGGQGHAERFGEALMEFDLPAAGGRVAISKSANIGGVMQVAVKGTFTVTLARP
jgi:hypothetical protein